MEFQLVSSFEDYRTEKILQGYTSSFPAEERRDDTKFRNLFENPNVNIFSILEDQHHKGYLITWHLSQGLFLEHFEIYDDFRGQNLGSKVLTELHKIYPKIILESEPSDLNDIAARRIDFYKRNSFAVVDEAYVQPSYGEGKPSLNLYLLTSFPCENLDLLKEEIWDTVYH